MGNKSVSNSLITHPRLMQIQYISTLFNSIVCVYDFKSNSKWECWTKTVNNKVIIILEYVLGDIICTIKSSNLPWTSHLQLVFLIHSCYHRYWISPLQQNFKDKKSEAAVNQKFQKKLSIWFEGCWIRLQWLLFTVQHAVSYEWDVEHAVKRRHHRTDW